MPPHLMTFDGRPYRTEVDWTAAFDAFHAARRRWWADRDLPPEQIPDYRINGECPFDPDSI